MPILNGRFSPKGYSFAVSTYYGSFSIYGDGMKESFNTTPIQ